VYNSIAEQSRSEVTLAKFCDWAKGWTEIFGALTTYDLLEARSRLKCG
jgi:hypothetical protein